MLQAPGIALPVALLPCRAWPASAGRHHKACQHCRALTTTTHDPPFTITRCTKSLLSLAHEAVAATSNHTRQHAESVHYELHVPILFLTTQCLTLCWCHRFPVSAPCNSSSKVALLQNQGALHSTLEDADQLYALVKQDHNDARSVFSPQRGRSQLNSVVACTQLKPAISLSSLVAVLLPYLLSHLHHTAMLLLALLLFLLHWLC